MSGKRRVAIDGEPAQERGLDPPGDAECATGQSAVARPSTSSRSSSTVEPSNGRAPCSASQSDTQKLN